MMGLHIAQMLGHQPAVPARIALGSRRVQRGEHPRLGRCVILGLASAARRIVQGSETLRGKAPANLAHCRLAYPQIARDLPAQFSCARRQQHPRPHHLKLPRRPSPEHGLELLVLLFA